MSNEFLSLDEFLSSEKERAARVFESKVWCKADGTPGKLQYRVATVGDREAARQAAKTGDKFDNATYGAQLIALCLLAPKVPPMEVVRLREKNALEMDRLLDAILEGDKANPR